MFSTPRLFASFGPHSARICLSFDQANDWKDAKLNSSPPYSQGWEELYKQYIEKQWADRSKEFQEKGAPKLLRWDPVNPKNKETYEISRTYDDDEEDLMDVSFAPKAGELWNCLAQS